MRFKLLLLVAVSTALFSCNQGNTNNSSQNDSIAKVNAQKQSEADLIAFSDKVVTALKEKNFNAFAEFIHPTEGVRFSAAAYIDAKGDKILQKNEIIELSKNNKDFTWGIHEAIGDPIVLSINKYFEQYVYDVDFLTKAQKQINQATNTGNSVGNIKEIYPKYDFVEYHFKGENKEYEGLDWKTLTLIFKKENDKFYLVAITHGQWTP